MIMRGQKRERSESGALSQTLDRGLRALAAVAEAAPLTVNEVADRLDVHRSVAYRLLRTLEAHGLVERDSAGAYQVGLGLATMARGVRRTLQAASIPELSDVAADLGATAFVAVRANDEAVTLCAVEPRHAQGHVAHAPGVRHALGLGAPGLAILAGGPPQADEREAVKTARSRGWAHTEGEVVPGASAVATPIQDRRGEVVGAVAVVYVDKALDQAAAAARLSQAADAIAAELP